MSITGNIKRKFQQKVLLTIQTCHLLEQGDAVVVGVSGGPDSVCLLHVLHSLSGELGINIHAVHINHMLRAEEAMADEAYAEGLCDEFGIPFIAVRVNISEMAHNLGMSLEEAGREARYREFATIARNVGATKIAVAHNRNDQAETVMMHIMRGSGSAGLAGMEFKRGALIRPLLNISREDIEQYCKAVGLSPRTDSSNLKNDFTRNRVRLDLFPYIKENFGVDMTESLCRLSGHAAVDNDYLDRCAGENYRECLIQKDTRQADADTRQSGVDTGRSDTDIRQTGTDTGQADTHASAGGCIGENIAGIFSPAAYTDMRVSLSLERLRKLHPAILVRVLKLAVCDIAGNSSGIGSVHYTILADLAKSGRTGARAELPGGLRAAVTYDALQLDTCADAGEEAVTTSAFAADIVVPGTTCIPELNACISVTLEKAENVDNYGRIGYNSLVQFFDYDGLKMGINIRNRRDGDIFKPFKSNGTKKLKEYFIDNKIPRETRAGIPLVCRDKEVVWVIGYKISDKFKVTENTKSVLRMEYNRRISL